MTARFKLKQATAAAHHRVDRAFGHHDLADRAGYGRFLSSQAAALIPLEEALTAAGAARMIEGWDDHFRAPLLRADLTALGLDVPDPIAPAPMGNDSELAGALYVLEGSRLGGALLRRSVPADLPAAFLSAPQAAGRWTRFAMSLEQLLDTPAKIDAAIAAANGVFDRFEQAAHDASAA